MTTIITIQDNTFHLTESGWRCECGAIIKQEKSLEQHQKTKTHNDKKWMRRMVGNTTIHVSLLTPGQVVFR